MSFKCHTCVETHEGLPDIGVNYPDPYFDVPEDERDSRVFVTSDLCSIDDEHFFIRGVIQIPVHGQDCDFGFGVWASQKKGNFQTYVDNFESDQIGPFFEWLSTRLSCYSDDTFCLKTMAHFRGGKRRPYIEVEPTEHQLAIDQRNGITFERAWKLAHRYI
jgi:hypothetical protein